MEPRGTLDFGIMRRLMSGVAVKGEEDSHHGFFGRHRLKAKRIRKISRMERKRQRRLAA